MRKVFIFASILFFPAQVFALGSLGDRGRDVKKDFHLTSRLFVDNVFEDKYQSTSRKDEYKETRLMLDVISVARYKKKWFGYINYRVQNNPIQSSETLRRNALPNGGGDRTYEDHVGVLREIYAGFDGDVVKLYGGKFRPDFGYAYRIGRGIWGGELAASRYNLLEKIGVGGALKLGDAKTVGKYVLGTSFFTNDRKNFDGTQFTGRDQVSKSDAEIGDTRSLQSFVGNLDVNFDFGKGEKLFYRFSYMNLSPNKNALMNSVAANKIADQRGYSVMMKYKYPVVKNYNINYFIEYADLKNVGGDSDISERYFNTSLQNNFFKNYNLFLSFEEKRNRHVDQNGQIQQLSEISTGYTFFGNKQFFDILNFQIGHKHLRTNNVANLDKRNSHAFMVRYIKYLDF